MSSNAALLVDRFVSASSADDLKDSLQAICTALQSAEKDSLDPSLIWGEEGALDAFLVILTSSEYKSIPVDQGPPLICQIYSEFLKSRESKVILQQPEPGRLIQALLDVVSNSEESSYARVSSLQVLQKICSKFPSIAQSQLLEVPNGLHRLADSFAEENEQVRNEIVLVAKVIAEWPSCAKVWVFAEVCNSVIDLVIKEGGMTKGNVLVLDCLVLLHSLLKHDASLSDLVWQAPNFADKLCSLVDLRLGSEFLDPKSPSQPDDLDDILKSGDESKTMTIPRLTKNEETVLEKVIDLLEVMLGLQSTQKMVWKQYPKLGSMLWELALFSPPPPEMPFDCAVPPASLQQKALECVSLFFLSSEMMDRHNGLDRLLHLVCSGGAAYTLDEKRGLSQSALHVIRQMLTDEMSNKIVMHTLAPPMSTDAPETEPTVVAKLLNTLLENLEKKGDEERRGVMLLGALGALGVFLRDNTSREMMLRIISPRSLINLMLKSLDSEDDVVTLAFLRFLSELIIETPAAVESVLACPESMVLSVLFGSTGKKATLAGLFLGISMSSINDENTGRCGGWTKSSIVSMISKRKGGVTGFIGELEELKNVNLPWCACKLEEEVFANWYSVEVLHVRRLIVQGLSEDITKTGEQEDVKCTKGISIHDLQSLVNQQSKELEVVRNDLLVAEEALQSRESQVETWKRRVESTPTQLDDMLTEYVTKVEELTSDNVSLKTQLGNNQDVHQKDLKENEMEIKNIREKYEQALRSQEESEREAECLRTELEALSTAYANLEDEYNKNKLTPSASPSDQVFSAANHSEGQQPQGEVSCQGYGVNEIEEIRAENARLRNDARAADEWMQLAHRRMVEIESKNTQLQQEIHELEKSKEEISKGNFESIGTEPPTESKSFEFEKNIENRVRLEFQERLEKSELETNNVLRSRELLTMEKTELCKQLECLKTELELAKADVTSLREERHHLERQITSKNDGESSNESELVEQLRIDLKNKQSELDSLRASGKATTGGSTASTVEMEKYLNLEEELGAKNQKIIELEARLAIDNTSNSEPAKNETVHSTVHSELEAKCSLYENQIAALSQQIAATRDENLVKSTKLEEMTEKLDEFQKWSVAAQGKLTTLMAEKDKVEQELEQRKSSSADAGGSPEDEEYLKDLRSKLDLEQLEKEALEVKCKTYQNEIEELSKNMLLTSEENSKKTNEMQKLEMKLGEFQQWSVAAQDKLEKVTAEKEIIAAECEKVKREMDKFGEIGEISKDGHDRSGDKESEESLKKDFDTKCAAYESDIEQLSKEITVLRNMDASKSSELEELTKKLEEFQNWSVTAQEKMNSIQAEKEAMEKELQQMKLATFKTDDSDASVEDMQKQSRTLESETKLLQERLTVIEMELNVSKEKVYSLESAIEEKESNLSILRDEIQEQKADSEQVKVLKHRIEELEEDKSKKEKEAYDIVEQWSTRCSNLEEKNAELNAKVNGMSETNGDRVRELELAVASLESSLETQQEDFSDAIEKWSSRCKELEETTALKMREEAAFSEQISDLQQSLLDANSQVEQEKEANASLTGHLDVLKYDLSTTKEKLMEVVAESEGADELKCRLQAQQAEILEQSETIEAFDIRLKDLQEELKITRESRDNFREHVKALQDEMASIQKKSECKDIEMKEKVNEWEGRCVALEEEKSKLLEETQTLATELEAREEEIGTQLNEEQHLRTLAEQTSRDALAEVEMLAKQSEEAIQQWQDRVGELESIVAELDQQLEEQQSEAIDAIAQWEATCSELESKARETESSTFNMCAKMRDILVTEKQKQFDWIIKLDTSYESNVDLSLLTQVQMEEFPSIVSSMTDDLDKAMGNTIEMLKASVSDAREKDQEQNTELELIRSKLLTVEQKLTQAVENKNEVNELNTSLKVEIDEVRNSLRQAKSKLEALSSKMKELEGELKAEREITNALEGDLITEKEEVKVRTSIISNLEKEVGQLTEELEKTNQSLQVQITDEISKKATEMTTEALRGEIDQLRSRIDNKHEMLIEERRARKSAEQSVKSLTDDLAMLLKVNKSDAGFDERVKAVVVAAGESIQREERQEIEELRSSLERSQQELDLSKTNENTAYDRALAAEAQAAISEQETIAAKADVAFLSQSLEDIKEADAARVATFEYRIKALEDDRELMRRVNADELETLRNEVSRTMMEKDRIFHALKESEKANAALARAMSKEPETNQTLNVDDELRMLRTSNAHLLVAATEQAANSERRIREAVTANASSAEADIIVERELRVAAETGLEHIKAQLDELRKSRQEIEMQAIEQNSTPGKKQSQVSQIRTKARKLEIQNAELQKEIESLKASTEDRITELTEQCRRAQAVAMKFEGKERFNAEVRAEVKKSQSLHQKVMGKDENWIIINDENSGTNVNVAGMSASEAYDYIAKQQTAIEEERKIYKELLVEHDELLALLAQQDLEKDCLNVALIDAMGEEAVEAAILEAEEKAIQKFGKYIRTT